jgi:hypothetical protein
MRIRRWRINARIGAHSIYYMAKGRGSHPVAVGLRRSLERRFWRRIARP